MIISYYTDNYSKEARNLIKSLQAFDLPHLVQNIDDRGGWDKNTHYKPIFILNELMKHEYVVWTDADSVFKQDPVLFKELTCDVAFHRFKGSELLSGTVFFKNTPRTIQLLCEWIAINSKNPKTFDQVNLDAALKYVEDLVVGDLPPEYCFIFDLSREVHPNLNPVISHYQASRTHRIK